MSSTAIPRVVPAQLSFLALYNPSLGASDDTIQDQIVFYYSKHQAKAKSRSGNDSPETAAALREQKNEQLRQVGLAQGMVGFARSFSNGEAVDSIETERSRIVLYELEPRWWILASIDLTRLPAPSNATPKTADGNSESPGSAIEYSSREVSPPGLLLKQLVRANSTFLLHHGASLEFLFQKLGRTKFCNALDRFWTKFATHWDVLLHGSPAVDVFHGMKLACGGELGMGVGEEEWGSGEREVLEDFSRRTEGLVDIMVSRFGEPSDYQGPASKMDKDLKDVPVAELEPWIGKGRQASGGDGVVFSGVGALSRRSIRDVSNWVEDIYKFGDYAYGVKDSPTADRRKRRRRNPDEQEPGRLGAQPQKTRSRPASGAPVPAGPPPGIPPPIVTAAEVSLNKASKAVDSARSSEQNTPEVPNASLDDAETWMKYLTLGYGSAWGGKRSHGKEKCPSPNKDVPESSPEPPMRYVEPEPDVDHLEEKLKFQIQQENNGYFIIGLKGSLEEQENEEDSEEEWNNRIPLRTIHVEVVNEVPTSENERPTYVDDLLAKPKAKHKLSRLRPVVYVHRPFIYTFLFTHRTESLTLATFYRNLHTYFAPLHRPLSKSTSPSRVQSLLSAASHPYTTTSSTSHAGPNTQTIYDLVYDPRSLTVHSSLPNIPDPGHFNGHSTITNVLPSWSRAEALNVHSQILSTVASTRRTFAEIERTSKTSRGWWVVWMRLPPSSEDPPSPVHHDADVSEASDPENPGFRVADLREAFLVRKSNDGAAGASSAKSSGSSGMWGMGLGMGMGGQSTERKMGGKGAGWGPKGLAEGIGIDARKYVEALLSLNR